MAGINGHAEVLLHCPWRLVRCRAWRRVRPSRGLLRIHPPAAQHQTSPLLNVRTARFPAPFARPASASVAASTASASVPRLSALLATGWRSNRWRWCDRAHWMPLGINTRTRGILSVCTTRRSRPGWHHLPRRALPGSEFASASRPSRSSRGAMISPRRPWPAEVCCFTPVAPCLRSCAPSDALFARCRRGAEGGGQRLGGVMPARKTNWCQKPSPAASRAACS